MLFGTMPSTSRLVSRVRTRGARGGRFCRLITSDVYYCSISKENCMNKKLIALAVAGAFAPAVALAQGTNVTIYGTLNAAWNFVEAKGATPGVTPGVVSTIPGTNLSSGFNVGARSRVDPDSSNIGFRVREDLGGGLAAWGQ